MHELPFPTDDGLTTSTVGDWSRDKHHFLWRYLNAFTTAMKAKRWRGLHYIDLFAGAGIEKLKRSKELNWGSPLLAAQAKNPFSRLHLCEQNRKKYEALVQRMKQFRQPSEPQFVLGNANDKIYDIVKEIPTGTLSLAFLDPYGLHLDFATVETLSKQRVDLIIFFPDRLDALRNWKVYEATPNSNLDRFMGEGADWLGAMQQAPRDRWAEVLLELYVQQMHGLGYKHFEYEVFMPRGGHCTCSYSVQNTQREPRFGEESQPSNLMHNGRSRLRSSFIGWAPPTTIIRWKNAAESGIPARSARVPWVPPIHAIARSLHEPDPLTGRNVFWL